MIQIDIKMPKCCDECFALDDHGDYPFCLISQDQRGYTFNTKEKRMPTCPLKAQEPVTGETSDGYHTFNELYHHRAVLFSVIVMNYPDKAWKSKKHHDGTMYNGMFIVGIDTPDGQATYHYDIDPYWDMFKCRVLDNAPEWDGHTPAQAIERIGKLKAQEPRVLSAGIMNDLILRGAAIEALNDENLRRNVDSVYDGDMNRTRRAAHRVIAQLPAVEAIPVEWLEKHDDEDIRGSNGTSYGRRWITVSEVLSIWQKEQAAKMDE